MRIKAFFISLLLLLATPLLRAGEKLPFVMGKVYDEQGRPMSAVIVEQVGTSAYAVTARDGWFNLNLEPRRRPKISIRFIGYHTLTLDVEDTDSMVTGASSGPPLKVTSCRADRGLETASSGVT